MLYIARYDSSLNSAGENSSEELRKARKFLKEGDGSFFLFRRRERRRLLGLLAHRVVDASEIRLEECGKPFCKEIPFHFSDSHRQEHYFFSAGLGPMGIDAEPVQAFEGWRELAGAYFSIREQSLLHGIEDFFYVWTRKEALVKAIGCGIVDDWKQYEVVEGEVWAAKRQWVLRSYRWRNWLIACCCEARAAGSWTPEYTFSDSRRVQTEQGSLIHFTPERCNFTI